MDIPSFFIFSHILTGSGCFELIFLLLAFLTLSVFLLHYFFIMSSHQLLSVVSLPDCYKDIKGSIEQ